MERLIEIITREVVAELQRRGIELDGDAILPQSGATQSCRRAVIDLGMYKTPVLTEHHVASLAESVVEIVIPKGTIITPGARDVIKRRSLVVSSGLSTK